MYKYIGLMMLGLWTTTANAYTSCVGGTEVTSPASCVNYAGVEQCNGHTFCKSNRQMNWWSAINWCQSNGGTLASYTNVCPNTEINKNCPNRPGTSLWLKESAGGGSAFLVFWNGALQGWGKTAEQSALCE